jgi:hypothetical protein
VGDVCLNSTKLYSAFFISPNNNTFEVLFNGASERSGSLLEEFTPAVNPPKEIDDPKDSKPSDWVDEKQISDPDAKKVRSYYPGFLCIAF